MHHKTNLSQVKKCSPGWTRSTPDLSCYQVVKKTWATMFQDIKFRGYHLKFHAHKTMFILR